MDNCEYEFKYIIVGDSSVGKSCFMLRFTDSRFKPSHDITIGLEFGTKTVKHKKNQIKFQIWDTAGQENFRSIARSYYRGAVGVILMYDISNKDSFLNTFRWLKEVKEIASSQITIVLVGNKLDLEDKRTVVTSEAKDFAELNNLLFFEASALNGTNVEKVFMTSSEKIIEKVNRGEIDISLNSSGVKVSQKEVSKKKKSCC